MSEKRLKLYGWLVLVLFAMAISIVVAGFCGFKLVTAYWPVFISTLPIAILWAMSCAAIAVGLGLAKIIKERIGDTKYNEKHEAEIMIFRSSAQ